MKLPISAWWIGSRCEVFVHHPYFEELLACLNARKVRYLVVGGYAVAHHGRPRFTKDLDLLVAPEPQNAERTHLAIRDFFSGADPGFQPSDLLSRRTVVQLGVAPVRIDLMTTVAGVGRFESAWSRRVRGRIGRVVAHFISRTDLLKAKRASGRLQDLADAEALARAVSWTRRSGLRTRPAKR